MSNPYSLDPRSLAVLRAGLGLCLVVDTLWRFTAFRAHYTDAGVLPRSLLVEETGAFSLFLLGGDNLTVLSLLILTLLSGVALALGYKTRLACFLAWILSLSLQARNPLVITGGDEILRLLLFWGFFLPWSSTWSLDCRNKPMPKDSGSVSAGELAYTGQIILIYLFAALQKTGGPWRDGSALYYVLNIDQLVTRWGRMALEYPEYLKTLTFASRYFELLVGLFFILPFWTGVLRIIGVMSLIVFHIGIGLHLHLGIFSAIVIVAPLGLLPPLFWGSLLRLWPKDFLRLGERSSTDNTKQRKYETALVIVLFGLVLMRNIETLAAVKDFQPEVIRKTTRFFRLDQNWTMFAPYPFVGDGWFVAEGKLKNGKVVNLLHPEEDISWDKSPYLAEEAINYHWRKYYHSLSYSDTEPYREAFLHYLVREWDKSHRGPWQIDSAKLTFVLERTPEPGKEYHLKRLTSAQMEKKAQQSTELP